MTKHMQFILLLVPLFVSLCLRMRTTKQHANFTKRIKIKDTETPHQSKKESTTGARGHITRCTAFADTALLCSLEISELDAKVYVIKMLTRVLSCLSFFLLVSPIHFPRPLSLLH